jgi:hypothetical protein
MAQYTSSATTPGGSVVNTILDSVTNTLTITATTPAGTVATTTLDANGDLIDAVVNLRNQWSASEPTLSRTELSSGIRSATLTTVTNVKSQNTSASAVSTATNTPPPEEKQAIPVNPTSNPAVPPPTPAPETETATPQRSAQADAPQQEEEPAYTPLETPPGTDEFDGIDTQIANNENALAEPPVVSDEEVANYLNNLEQPEENPAPSEAELSNWAQGLSAPKLNTNSQATQQDVANFKQKEDWRVRLSLAPSANYLYKVPKGSAGILEPLQATDGVIFPYTPQIQVNYQANYEPSDLTHSNYKIFQYKNSGVDSISISCDFTAQDTYEANYLLAVIHFFRSVTKMFYGQDQNPKPGTPPPLCYLSGLGAFQFDAHPLAITSFNYSLPSDVDYIRAGAVTAAAGDPRYASNVPDNSSNNTITNRLGIGIRPGGKLPAPIFTTPPGTVDPTYVPTKIQMTIGAVPIVTRNDISNNFSLEKYATGALLRGSRRQGGGIW